MHIKTLFKTFVKLHCYVPFFIKYHLRGKIASSKCLIAVYNSAYRPKMRKLCQFRTMEVNNGETIGTIEANNGTHCL